ncbi:MAG: flavodoxin family protein [Burkholderiaceae bacterium]
MTKPAPTVVIAFHSGYGHTTVLADAVMRGARHAGAQSELLDVSAINDKGWQQLKSANAIVFGSPTYMGSVSGPFKVFADETAKVWFTQGWKDKIAGGFTCSMSMSGDKFSTLTYLVTLAMQHGMIWVGTAMMPSAEPGDPDAKNRLGSYLGVMAQADNSPPEESPPQGDIDTAFSYGERIARVAQMTGLSGEAG